MERVGDAHQNTGTHTPHLTANAQFQVFRKVAFGASENRAEARQTLGSLPTPIGPAGSTLVNVLKLPLISATPRAWLMTGDGLAVLADKPPPVHAEKVTARGRVPWGRYALMRALLRTPLPRTQQQLAAEVGLTQGAVSGALERLGTLAEKRSNGWVAANPGQAWDAFMAEYPGPGGVRTFWYSRTPFIRQAELLRPLTKLSADGAADELAPWRQPVQIVAYAESPIDMETLGFSPATAAEASVTITMPKDLTVFRTADAWNTGAADTPLAAWDLRASGGPDAEEAVDRLKGSVLGAFES